MDNLEIILDLAKDKSLTVREIYFESNLRGLIKNNIIAISKELSRQQKAETLLHELYHFDNQVGNLIDVQIKKNYNCLVEKEEMRIEKAVCKYFIITDDVCNKYKYCHNTFELSEELGVSEHLMNDFLENNWNKIRDLVNNDECQSS